MTQFEFDDGEAVAMIRALGSEVHTSKSLLMVLEKHEPHPMGPLLSTVVLYDSIDKRKFVYLESNIVPIDRERFEEWAATYQHNAGPKYIDWLRNELFGEQE